MKIFKNTGMLKACHGGHPRTYLLHHAMAVFALSNTQPSIHPSVHLHCLMPFKVHCEYIYLPHYFIADTVIFEEAQSKNFMLFNFRKLLPQRISDDF